MPPFWGLFAHPCNRRRWRRKKENKKVIRPWKDIQQHLQNHKRRTRFLNHEVISRSDGLHFVCAQPLHDNPLHSWYEHKTNSSGICFDWHIVHRTVFAAIRTRNLMNSVCLYFGSQCQMCFWVLRNRCTTLTEADFTHVALNNVIPLSHS